GTEPGSPYTSPESAANQSNKDDGKSVNATSVIKFVKDPMPMPEFTLKEINGGTISSGDHRGKVMLINFWATWCAPCRAELPDLIALQEKYQGKLQIIGLSDDTTSVENVRKFVKDNKINYPVALATAELESKFGGVMGLPTSFLVSTEGKVM